MGIAKTLGSDEGSNEGKAEGDLLIGVNNLTTKKQWRG
jgi:hypothetical protein